jgi:L-iditol 2-dehydrogenase
MPQPGDALVRVGFCGVCGSDIPRIFVKGTYRFPTVCGHEFAGTIEECGIGVERFSPGDRVTVFPLLWCGRCPACEEGKYSQCQDYDYLGSRSDGAFAEYVRVPGKNLMRVPDNVSLEWAAMVEPAAVALHALRRAGGCDIGETVSVFGAGPIGVMVAQWAREMGASKVLLFDLVPEKLKIAEGFGFEHVFNAKDADPVRTVDSLTDGQGAQVCIEAAGVPATLLASLASCRRSGSVVLLGNPAADVTVPAPLLSQVMRREIQILGTWNSDFSAAGNPDDWRTVLEAMATGRINLEPLITHRVDLEESLAALEMVRDGTEFFSKVLIRP